MSKKRTIRISQRRRIIKRGVLLGSLTPCVIVVAPARADLTLDKDKTQAWQKPAPWRETPLWKNTEPRLTNKDPKQHEMAQAIVNQSPMLKGLWDLRQTARGKGQSPQRSFKLGGGGQTALQLQTGTGALPAFDLAGWNTQSPSMGLKFGKVALGSTGPMNSLNYALRSYDAMMEEPGKVQPLQAQDKSQVNWLTAQPLEGKSGKINMLMASGRRDLTPQQKSGKRFSEGKLWGANGDLAVSSQWKLRGEFINSQLSEQEKGASAWKLGLDGPLRHRWGVAKVMANYSDSQAGFATFSSPAAPANDRKAGEVAVQQDVAIGDIQGTTKVAVTQIEQTPLTTASPTVAPPTTRSDSVAGVADLRYKLTPSVSLLGKHEQSSATQKIVAPALTPAADGNAAAPANLTDRSASDVGVELKLTRSVALAVTGGQTRTGNSVLRPDVEDAQPVSLLDEGRATVKLKRQTRGSMFGVSLGHRTVADEVKRDSDLRAKDVRFEAERQLFSWLKLKGSLGLANEKDIAQRLQNERTLRSVEAQLALPFLGRFDMRYNDLDGQRATDSALTPLPGSKEYGLRYNVGDPNGNGLGLSVEYSKRVDHATADPAKWRVGITYK